MYLDHSNNNQTEESFDEYLAQSLKFKSVNGPTIRLNINRSTLIAIVVSLLIHLVIFFFAPKIKFDQPPASASSPISVSLVLPKSSAVAPLPNVETTAAPKITPVKKPTVAKPSKNKIITKIPTAKAESTFKVPDTPAPPSPKPIQEKENKLDPAKFPDMASYMKAVQASRQGAEYDAARQNAAAIASERGPTEDQRRDERIKNNFKSGTNGIFDITSLSSRRATFVFRGWTNDFSNAKVQYFEVEASTGQDIHLLIVKRVISLIREHYDGDFTWESRRLGRSLTQSARLEDNAGLEDFLMKEFFDTK